MKPSDRFSGARVLRATLAAAILGLPLTARANVYTYELREFSLINMPQSCGAGSFYQCGSDQGYEWADTLPAGSMIRTVRIQFNVGIDCHDTGTILATTLNGTRSGTYTSVEWCGCAQRTQLVEMCLRPDAYARGSVNTFLTIDASECLGACPAVPLGNLYGIVEVTYAYAGPGESCLNGVDDDGDGLVDSGDPDCGPCVDSDRDGRFDPVDCQPADPGSFETPAEVPRNMTVTRDAGGVKLAWSNLASQAGSGVVYDVVSGEIGRMRVDRSIAAATCLVDDLSTRTTTDARLLGVPNDGYYYLVRGQNDCLPGIGTYGSGSPAAPPRAPSSDCP